jgi:5-methylcytosine-specific restriction endonuclease McrA
MSQRKKNIRETFRKVVFDRDAHQCKICGSKDDLAAHHITDRTLMPHGGYVRANGITVCPPCHERAEQFHISGGEKYDEGWSPDDLYVVIGSSHEEALHDAHRVAMLRNY